MRDLAKIVALCLLAGALGLAAVAEATLPASEPATLSFVGITTRGNERTDDYFNPAHTATIVVVVSWQTLVGVHRQRVELIAPDGSIYEQFKKNISSSSGVKVAKTSVRVAGTWITEYQMFGEWTVNVYLDDDPTPVTSGHFIIAH
jgi:hypothetical protein